MPRVLVVDASVAIKWIVDESGSSEARTLLLAAEEILIAPTLLLVEVQYAIAKRYFQGQARTNQLARAVPALIAAFSAFAPLDVKLAEAAAAMSFPLPARAEALSPPFGVYDCVYIALAKQERATLVTADRRQAEIARTLNVPVSTI